MIKRVCDICDKPYVNGQWWIFKRNWLYRDGDYASDGAPIKADVCDSCMKQIESSIFHKAIK